MASDTHYFYVLYCQDQTFYGGYTTEPERRLNEHNTGVGAKYTRLAKRRPVQMIYTEAFADKSSAMKAEYAFKHQTRAKKIAFLEKKLNKKFSEIVRFKSIS